VRDKNRSIGSTARRIAVLKSGLQSKRTGEYLPLVVSFYLALDALLNGRVQGGHLTRPAPLKQ